MDFEYDQIYANLYGPFRQQLGAPQREAILIERFHRGREGDAVRRAIDDVQREGQYPIRSDAKYFLYVNLLHMVVVPTQVRGNVGLDDLEQYIHSDLRLLLAEAAARQAPGREISGHTMLETIAASWRNLKLSDFRLWGED